MSSTLASAPAVLWVTAIKPGTPQLPPRSHSRAPGGELCAERLAWLDARLSEAPDRPTVVFQHHPPFRTGIAYMDAMGLAGCDGLARVIARHPQVERILCGHLHRPISGTWMGIPYSVLPATNHQVALDFVIEGVVPGSHEPPAYAVILLEEDRSVIHLRSFLDRTNTFRL